MNKKLIGEVAVDSGQLLLLDPAYLSRWKDDEFDAPSKPDELSYSNACRASLSDNRGGAVGKRYSAVSFSSGFGDGVYPVIAHYKDYGTKKEPDIRIRKVEIILIN